MRINIAEQFYSIQGEGIYTGMPAWFIRLSGCNMSCGFCDTDFSMKEHIDINELVTTIRKFRSKIPFQLVVITGGEPLLQFKEVSTLSTHLDSYGFKVQIETNGSIDAKELDKFCSITCSPKTSVLNLKLKRCDSLKIIFPYQQDITAHSMEKYFERGNHIKWKSLQPIDIGSKKHNNYIIQDALEEVKRLGGDWRLGLQIHKIIGER